MTRQKITMVDPWQITSRGWKAFRTPKSVESFANKYHVHHVYWRTPGKKPILLVDFNHFKECYQEFRKTPKPTTTTTKPGTKKTSARRRPTVEKPTYRTGASPTTPRSKTWSNRPKPRSSWSTYRKSSYR